MMLSADAKLAERRLHPRTQLSMPLQLTRMDPDGGDLVEQVEMVDISRGGLGAICGRWHYPGQRVVVRLPGPGMSARNICGIVRRCAPVGWQFRVGIEFDRPIGSLCAEDLGPTAAAA